MAFDLDNFQCIANGIRNVFFYYTSDTIAVAKASGYFTASASASTADNCRYDLHLGDIIIVSAESGASSGIFTVSSASGASPATVTNGVFT